MANVDPNNGLVNSLQGLTDGYDALAGYALARTYSDQGELYAAAHCLGKHLKQLFHSDRFWQSINYVIHTLQPAADVGESLFVKFKHEILTGSHQLYQETFLSGPHAIDLISRVLPYSVAVGPTLAAVGTNTRSLIQELGASLSEYAGAQPNTEPHVAVDLPPQDTWSRFGRLMMGLGRGLLVLAGAGIAGANAYVVISTGAVTPLTYKSMYIDLLYPPLRFR